MSLQPQPCRSYESPQREGPMGNLYTIRTVSEGRLFRRCKPGPLRARCSSGARFPNPYILEHVAPISKRPGNVSQVGADRTFTNLSLLGPEEGHHRPRLQFVLGPTPI